MKGLNCQHHQPSIRYWLYDAHDPLSNYKYSSIAFRFLNDVIKTCIRWSLNAFDAYLQHKLLD